MLIVDDEPLFLTSVEDALHSAIPHLEVLRAEDGKEALVLAGRGPDILVTDLRMPRLDGVELLVALTQREIFLPTIVVTAHGTPSIEARVTSLGALAFIEKPVDLSVLVELIRQRLELPGGGTMAGVSLPGFLQLISMERKSCVLRAVTDHESGAFVFVDGTLVDARLPTMRGDAAAVAMCRWNRPIIHVEPAITLAEDTVTMPLEHLLLESARRDDEADWRQLKTGELPLAASVLDSLNEAPTPAAYPHDSAAVSMPETAEQGEEQDMSNVSESLDQIMSIDGSIAAALVDFESGLTLGTAGGGTRFDIDVAAAGNTQVVRAKMSVMHSLGIKGTIEDILITLDDQYHLIRPLKSVGTLFLYLAIDKTRGNLGLARHKLSSVEKELRI